MISDDTLEAIYRESLLQDEKWGLQDHEPEIWLAILVEEVGELAQAMLADRFDKGHDVKMNDSHSDSMETEAIQIGAVAGQFVDAVIRREAEAEEAKLNKQRAQ